MRTIVASSRRPRPRILAATILAFTVSGYFVGGTIVDFSGTREDSNPVQTLWEEPRAVDDSGYDPFKRDAVIGGALFGVMALITIGCLVAFSGARRQLDYDEASHHLLARKHAGGRAKHLPLAELERLEVSEEEFDDALAQAADATRPIETKLTLHTKSGSTVIACDSRPLALKAVEELEALMSAQAARGAK